MQNARKKTIRTQQIKKPVNKTFFIIQRIEQKGIDILNADIGISWDFSSSPVKHILTASSNKITLPAYPDTLKSIKVKLDYHGKVR